MLQLGQCVVMTQLVVTVGMAALVLLQVAAVGDDGGMGATERLTTMVPTAPPVTSIHDAMCFFQLDIPIATPRPPIACITHSNY